MHMMYLLLLPVTALRLTSSTAVLTADMMKVPAFDSVITMLQNLVSQIEAEASADDQDYESFMRWFSTQESTTSSATTALSTKLQELSANLSELRSRQQTVGTGVRELQSELDVEQGQLNDAQDKRSTEHDAFVKEQLDFDNSIAACERAVAVLKTHFGDGEPKESTKPAWMDLMGILTTITKAAKKSGRHVPAGLIQLQQPAGAVGSSLFNAYEEKTGEATNIVEQVGELSSTFAEDKASSVEQENELQGAFSGLLAQKQAIIASLTTERDAQQAILNSVTQQIAEHEGAQQTAQTTLTNEQGYLQQIRTQETDTTALYGARQRDREAEKAAVQQAHTILSEQNPALIQMKKSHKRRALLQLRAKAVCKSCPKAAALLTDKAKQYHSELLATAAATTGAADALGPVITQLEELVARLDEEANAETKHKEWCDSEVSATAAKKGRHETLVTQLNAAIIETTATIGDKQQALQDNQEAISKVDNDFTDLSNMRSKANADYTAELQDYVDAISALNEAMDILAQFYQEQGSALIQTHYVHAHMQAPDVPAASDKSATPEMGSLSGDYAQKGGSSTLQVLQQTRQEFEHGKETLISTESTMVTEFESSKTSYNGNRGALVDSGNRLTVELQTAQGDLASHQGNLQSNTEEVNAATNYLTQISGSCDSLNAHFDDRQALRAQEKTAIHDAIEVLRAA